MQKLLLRRTLRDIKTNLLKYLALCLLMVLVMFLVISLVGSADSIIRTVEHKAVQNQLEDGQFGMLMPLTDNDIDNLKKQDVVLEKNFYLDFSSKDSSTLRIMKNRKQINLIEISEGRLARTDREIVLERLFAQSHGLNTGDIITIGAYEFTVSGIGTSPDYEHCLQSLSDMSSDGQVFGTAFVTSVAYTTLLNSQTALHSEEYLYSFILPENMNYSELKETLLDLSLVHGETQNKLTDFVKSSDNPRIKAAIDDVTINRNVGLLAGIILLVLISYVISVFVIHTIEQESAIIGTLYALGLKQKQLLFHYTMLPVILCFIGGILGTLAGYSKTGLSMMTAETSSYYSTPPVETTYHPALLVYGLLLPPLIAFVVNALLIHKKLNQSPLSLLRKDQNRGTVSKKQLQSGNFIRIFQLRQFLREKRSSFAVLAGMFISLLVLILGLNCYALSRNIKVKSISDTKYEYMYQYKYPDEKIPSDGYAVYVEGLKKEVLGQDMKVNIIGTNNDNPFFPDITSKSKTEISISTSVASKYGLHTNDEFILHDKLNDNIYGFVVKEIVDYSPGLNCFMNIDSMRELFGRSDDFYNVVYADHKLTIDSDKLYSVSTKRDVERSSSIFMEIMMPLILTMTVSAALVFLIVLYQMMKVMIDRSVTSISLMKVFGYRNKEIRKLYLDGNFLLVSFSALFIIPLAKWIMDKIYPFFVSNVACGLDLTWMPLMYVLIYIGLVLSYLLIRSILLNKLKKVTPADILKDRE
jgi:ABC-type lipoprotein release transport system permease subunit